MNHGDIKQSLPILAIFSLSLLISVTFNTLHFSNPENEKAAALSDNYHVEDLGVYLFKTQDARYPLLTVLLSLLHYVFHGNLFWIRFFMSFLIATNCVLIYAIAKEVANRRVAFLAGLLAALYPNLFYWGALLSTEVLFTTLFLAAIYLIVKSKENPSINKLVLTGIFLGLAALARGALLFFLPFFFIWAVYFYWGDKKAMLKTTVCVFAMAIITIAPWTIRNYIVFGKLVPVAINGGRALFGGNNFLSLSKNSRGLGLWDGTAMEKLLPETNQMTLFEKDRHCYKKSIEWIICTLKNKPLDMVKLELWKIQKAYFPKILDRDSRSKKLFYFAYFCVTALGIIGIAISLPERRKYSLFYFILFAYLLTVLIFFGEVRLRAPFDPFLIIFSALSTNAIYEQGLSCLRFDFKL